MCASCRAHEQKKNLFRFVRQSGVGVVLDNEQRCAGRGVYLCKKHACIAKAAKTNVFSRIFKVQVPNVFFATLCDQVAKGDE
jgi:predicted RNA-binding protein YlxR (DUF448 family)